MDENKIYNDEKLNFRIKGNVERKMFWVYNKWLCNCLKLKQLFENLSFFSSYYSVQARLLQKQNKDKKGYLQLINFFVLFTKWFYPTMKKLNINALHGANVLQRPCFVIKSTWNVHIQSGSNTNQNKKFVRSNFHIGFRLPGQLF